MKQIIYKFTTLKNLEKDDKEAYLLDELKRVWKQLLFFIPTILFFLPAFGIVQDCKVVL